MSKDKTWEEWENPEEESDLTKEVLKRLEERDYDDSNEENANLSSGSLNDRNNPHGHYQSRRRRNR